MNRARSIQHAFIRTIIHFVANRKHHLRRGSRRAHCSRVCVYPLRATSARTACFCHACHACESDARGGRSCGPGRRGGSGRGPLAVLADAAHRRGVARGLARRGFGRDGDSRRLVGPSLPSKWGVVGSSKWGGRRRRIRGGPRGGDWPRAAECVSARLPSLTRDSEDRPRVFMRLGVRSWACQVGGEAGGEAGGAVGSSLWDAVGLSKGGRVHRACGVSPLSRQWAKRRRETARDELGGRGRVLGYRIACNCATGRAMPAALGGRER